jgi:antitoxin HicB
MTSRRFAVVEVEHSIKPPTLVNRMATSRSQLDRVSDPSNVSVQLDTLIKAARALGKEIEIKIKRAAKKEAA